MVLEWSAKKYKQHSQLLRCSVPIGSNPAWSLLIHVIYASAMATSAVFSGSAAGGAALRASKSSSAVALGSSAARDGAGASVVSAGAGTTVSSAAGVSVVSAAAGSSVGAAASAPSAAGVSVGSVAFSSAFLAAFLSFLGAGGLYPTTASAIISTKYSLFASFPSTVALIGLHSCETHSSQALFISSKVEMSAKKTTTFRIPSLQEPAALQMSVR
mmetsp:Transcript_41641/g.50503  ORF Transcript_41641/g.50503 Transcript_41641/m.50503 type:complete len:215 (-) Transcript_41641:473-1117(-)